MPDGGYPLQLLLPFAGSDLLLHIRSTRVSLVRRIPANNDTGARPTFERVADLTKEQAGALAFHLLYWSGTVSHGVLAGLPGGRLPVRPQFRSAHCRYDY